jgi:hypothetical protein
MFMVHAGMDAAMDERVERCGCPGHHSPMGGKIGDQMVYLIKFDVACFQQILNY